jgi:hypothetical protein
MLLVGRECRTCPIYHIISYRIISYYIILYYIISYHIASHHITSHYITSHRIVSYLSYHIIHIISYHIISYHTIPYHIISYHIIYKVIKKPLCIWWLQYKKHAKIFQIPTQLMIWRWPSQNTFGIWTVLYWTRSSRTQFVVSINVWRLAGDTLNITGNFLYCNHQVHRDFLITLYYAVLFYILYYIISHIIWSKSLEGMQGIRLSCTGSTGRNSKHIARSSEHKNSVSKQ